MKQVFYRHTHARGGSTEITVGPYKDRDAALALQTHRTLDEKRVPKPMHCFSTVQNYDGDQR